MKKNNTTAGQAQSTLGVGEPDYHDAGMRELIHREYETRLSRAEHAYQDGKTGAARIHYGVAAAMADLLAQLYERMEDQLEAEVWVVRATRYNRRAFMQRNRIAENIGAEMP